MAKQSVIARNEKRKKMVAKYSSARKELKDIVRDTNRSVEERFKAQIKLNSMPRDGSNTRVRVRCAITGRGRGVYRHFMLSRICLRDLATKGLLPGVRKASW
ncbi:30S ribosomal protein S14 [Candidatus Fokinia solitaria]|uniref:Small ribosomal subunit protein uS14 n=1 Tax=Candidatus Fokinia solitaria TaxID=1802984 RepID=A0A2U8BRB7_9RICK|nr:30S ribosomal protein S14 [Candidatus Fokinia solitaria]AWD32882.1 30S ribosomal protein S14 [Candidatus Fokinia solitaria]